MSEKAAEQTEKLRVLVCDDHALFRRGLQMVLDQEADLELVGEASRRRISSSWARPRTAWRSSRRRRS